MSQLQGRPPPDELLRRAAAALRETEALVADLAEAVRTCRELCRRLQDARAAAARPPPRP